MSTPTPTPSGQKAAVSLVIVGSLSLINALAATSAGAEKNYHTDRFVNTHWITIIQLFAGLSQLFLVPRSLPSSTLALCTNCFSLVVSLSSLIADFCNLAFIVTEEGKSSPDGQTLQRMISYCLVDAVLSFTSIPLNFSLARGHFKNDHILPNELQCVRLLTLGTAQIAVSIIRLFAYLIELWWLKSVGGRKVSLLFINYTLDEPAWISLNILVGAFCVLSARGGRLLRSSSLSLCALSVLPCIFYLWLDYRWFSSVHLAPAVSSKPTSNPLLIGSMLLTIIEIGLLIAAMLLLFAQICPVSRTNLDARVRSFFFSVGVVFVLFTILVIFMDVYALSNKMFYRLFHGSEQKTPFLTALIAVFCFLSTNPTLSAFTLPACLTLCLLAINSTVFLLLSYVYLSSNGYFGEQLCDLFFPSSSQCFQPVTKEGATMHFLEAVTAFSILIMCFVVAAMIMRLSVLHFRTSDHERDMEVKKYEALIRTMGVCMAGCALTVLLSTLLNFLAFKKSAHPLVVVYLSLYHVSLAISLTVFPLYQILVSEKLCNYPMASRSLLMICVVRFCEVFSQLDYRGTGDQLSVPWKVHHTVEVLSLFGYFFTAIFVISLQKLSSTGASIVSDTVPMQFDNPLARSQLAQPETGTGYLQLRNEDDV